jgi:uncharacterized protein YjiS (DUF1127 family)
MSSPHIDLNNIEDAKNQLNKETDMAFLTDTKPASGHPLFSFADTLAKRARRLAQRKHLSQLLKLDDHLLRDVGVSRDQVRRALESSNSVDVATEVHRVSLSRPGPWM